MIKLFPPLPKAGHIEVRAAIKAAKNGCYNSPFIIAGLTSVSLRGEGISAYQFIISPEQDDGVGIISKEVAMQLVEDNDMTRIYAGEYGRVYECPGNPFLELWRGYHATKKLSAAWKTISTDIRCPIPQQGQQIWAQYVHDDRVYIYAPAEFILFFKEIDKAATSRPASKAFKKFTVGKLVRYKVI